MQMVEAGGKGLLKSRGYTPKVDSPLVSKPGSLKRKRQVNYEKIAVEKDCLCSMLAQYYTVFRYQGLENQYFYQAMYNTVPLACFKVH